MKTLNTKTLRRSITLMIAFVMMVLIGVSVLLTGIIEQERQNELENSYTCQLHQNIDHVIKDHIRGYQFWVRELIETTPLTQLLKEKNRKGLYNFLKPTWELLKEENPNLTAMQIHLADGRSFLRMHQPEKFGDRVAEVRKMLQEIHRNHQLISGYETGKFATVYRIIAPIFDTNNTYIGALELGINPNYIIDSIAHIGRFYGAVFIKDEDLKLFKHDGDLLIGRYRLQSKLTSRLKDIFDTVGHANSLDDHAYIKVKGDKYLSHLYVLKDYLGEPKVKIIFFQDLTQNHEFRTYLLVIFVSMTLLLFLVMVLFIYRRLAHYEHRITELYQTNNLYLNSVFNATPNIMVTTDGKMLDRANITMLDFFDYESVEAFHREHKCICDYFIEEEGCLRAERDGISWLEQIFLAPDDVHKVCMLKAEMKHHFIVKAQKLKIDEKDRSVVVFTDVTEIKELELQLRSSQELFERFMQNIPAIVAIKDSHNQIIYTNDKAAHFFHKESLLDINIFDLLPQEYAQKLDELNEQALREGAVEGVYQIELDQQHYVFRAMTFTIGNEVDTIQTGSMYFDITEQYQAQHEIAKFKQIIEKSPVSIVITDIDGNIEYVNPWFTQVTGYTLDEARGKTPRILKSDYHDEEDYVQLWDNITHDKVWNGVFKNITKEGDAYWESAIIAPIHNEAGIITNYIGIKQEISEEVYLREALRDQEELMIAQSRHAAMGEMISMIAHQWRQPISVIAMGANNILVDIELDEFNIDSLKEQLREILSQTQYLSQTIDDFRNFFRPDKEKETIKVEDVLDEAQKIIAKSLENNAIMLDIHSKNTLSVKTYSRELLQVFINIIKNAKEAITEMRSEGGFVHVRVYSENNDVVITICDNGGGVDEKYITKIFDPYFSTKDEKTGTGLGLYMSKIIIEKHIRGSIDVSNTQEGACFKIFIPAEGE